MFADELADKGVDEDDMKPNRFPHRQFERSLGLMLNGQYFITVGLELSEIAIRVRVQYEVTVNSGGVVTFRLPNKEFIVVKGDVSNVGKDEGGFFIDLKFNQLTVYQRRNIREFIAAKSTDTIGLKQKRQRFS